MIEYNVVEKEFLAKAVVLGGILLFKTEIAIEFVERCKELGIDVLGVDGFYLEEHLTEPSMENSIDLGEIDRSNLYVTVVAFLKKYEGKNLFFEIVCA